MLDALDHEIVACTLRCNSKKTKIPNLLFFLRLEFRKVLEHQTRCNLIHCCLYSFTANSNPNSARLETLLPVDSAGINSKGWLYEFTGWKGVTD